MRGWKEFYAKEENNRMKNKGFLSLTLFVVLVALASISCSAANLGNLFATETPTPTLTHTPTPTFTPSPTPTLTPTRTPTATPPPTGVTSEELADGSTLFIDYDNKFQLILPVDWVVILVERNTIADALDRLAEDNPHLIESAEIVRNMDPDVLRMVALYTDRAFVSGGSAPNMTLAVVKDQSLASLPLSFITGLMEGSFEQRGLKVLTTGVNNIENANNVEIEYIDLEQIISGTRVLQRAMIFKTGSNLFVLTITTFPQFRDDIFEMGDQAAASIEFLK